MARTLPDRIERAHEPPEPGDGYRVLRDLLLAAPRRSGVKRRA